MSLSVQYTAETTPGLYHMPPELQMLHTSTSMQHLQVHHAMHPHVHHHAHVQHGHVQHMQHGHVQHGHVPHVQLPHAATLGQLCHRHNTLYRAP
ncbi:hypothetical protein KGM_211782 [Danaus plexippus plexippus]|uniref:Uncharacterized protein n=1 Tax=Danaus plexippus plexippus TaxID=278856 RepID=A0A212EX54_DANPL|nr:hypothetical protein KGM_211782 [Danaus plexippus plexippus]